MGKNPKSQILLNECNGGKIKLLGWDLKLLNVPSAAEEEILEFFEKFPITTTSASTTWSVTSASSPETSARTRFVPDQEWSIAGIDVKETLIKDCRFEKAKNCLLKYVYGDEWNLTIRNCSETTADDIVTTTVLSESRMITTVLPKSYECLEGRVSGYLGLVIYTSITALLVFSSSLKYFDCIKP